MACRTWGSQGIAGVTVYLDLADTGSLQAGDPTTTTDSNGNYLFIGESPGTYTVREVLYGGVLLDTPSSGSYQVTVTSGADITGQDFADERKKYCRALVVAADDSLPQARQRQCGLC